MGSVKEDSLRRCVHFYACICAFSSDDHLADEFVHYINLVHTAASECKTTINNIIYINSVYIPLTEINLIIGFNSDQDHDARSKWSNTATLLFSFFGHVFICHIFICPLPLHYIAKI